MRPRHGVVDRHDRLVAGVQTPVVPAQRSEQARGVHHAPPGQAEQPGLPGQRELAAAEGRLGEVRQAGHAVGQPVVVGLRVRGDDALDVAAAGRRGDRARASALRCSGRCRRGRARGSGQRLLAAWSSCLETPRAGGLGQRFLPRTHGGEPGSCPGVVAEDAVARSRCRPDERRAVGRLDPSRVESGRREHRAGEPEPARLARVRAVVDARRGRPESTRATIWRARSSGPGGLARPGRRRR